MHHDIEILGHLRLDDQVVRGAVALATSIAGSSGEVVVEHHEGVMEPTFCVPADHRPVEGAVEVLNVDEEVAILGILHEIDSIGGFRCPFTAVVTIGSSVALRSPRIAHLDELCACIECHNTDHSVCMAVSEAVLVRKIMISSAGSGSCDDIIFAIRLQQNSPQFILTDAVRVHLDVWRASQGSDSHLRPATFSTAVVTPVLGKGFLKNRAPK